MKNKRALKAVAVVLAALAAAAGILAAVILTGGKEITVKVVQLDGSSEIYVVRTRQQLLGDALTDEGLVDGYEGDYGMYITAVAGVAADEALQQWWCLTKAGQSLDTGIDSVQTADGDVFELTLMQGW